MAFSINEFKSQVNKFGGPGHPGLFEVQFINPPFVFGSNARPRDLTFFCKSVAIPSMSVDVATYQAVAQRPKSFAMGMNSDPINCIFMLDSNHQIISFLHGWMQNVINYSTAGGNFAEVDGKLPYELGYKDDYSCRVIIRHYSAALRGENQSFLQRLAGINKPYYEVVLDNAFPVVVGDVDLSWDSSNSFATCGVSFAYDSIQYDGERVGSPTSRGNRGTGLLELLQTVGVLSQVVDTGFRPSGIQDAINTLTRFNNAADRLAPRN